MVTLISKVLYFILALGALLLAFDCNKAPDNKPIIQSSQVAPPQAVTVDELVAHPEKFKGRLSVTGTVTEVTRSRSAFLLGCEDACISLPVAFKGTMPKVGSELTVYGEVTKPDSDKYVLAAQEIRTK